MKRPDSFHCKIEWGAGKGEDPLQNLYVYMWSDLHIADTIVNILMPQATRLCHTVLCHLSYIQYGAKAASMIYPGQMLRLLRKSQV